MLKEECFYLLYLFTNDWDDIVVVVVSVVSSCSLCRLTYTTELFTFSPEYQYILFINQGFKLSSGSPLYNTSQVLTHFAFSLQVKCMIKVVRYGTFSEPQTIEYTVIIISYLID